MKAIICMFFVGLLLLMLSCNQNSGEKDREKFDTSLINRNSELHLSGEYEALIALNVEYLKKAAKMNYKAGKGLCYLNLADVNVSAGNYEKAQFFFNKAGRDLEDSENPYHKALYYNDYSLYYSHLELFDKAVSYNNKAFSYLGKAKKICA